MKKKNLSKWVWYAVCAAVLVGLFAPTMVAQAGPSAELVRTTCPTPK